MCLWPAVMRRVPNARVLEVGRRDAGAQVTAAAMLARGGCRSGRSGGRKRTGRSVSAPLRGAAASASAISPTPCVGGTRRNAPGALGTSGTKPHGSASYGFFQREGLGVVQRCEAPQPRRKQIPDEGARGPLIGSLSSSVPWRVTRFRRTLRRCSLHPSHHIARSVPRACTRSPNTNMLSTNEITTRDDADRRPPA